jgi:curved DNA-binding protein CbpA
MERADLYSQLKVSRDATEDEIHKAYKSLSTSFHPDKLPPTTPPEKREQIQLIFMEFKRASKCYIVVVVHFHLTFLWLLSWTDDVLTDPVLRLAYDYYGENGVRLVRRIQQHRREQKKRKEANVDDESDGEDDEMEANLYDKVERLLSTNPLQARAELQRFFEQHDYHQHLTEQNQVQLACSMEFPPVVNLEKLVYQGRDYVKFVQKRTYASTQGASGEDLEYYKQRIKQEQSIVDYQLNRFRESQKSEVGFTLSSTVPARNPDMTGTRVQPKWSMVMGGTTNLVYPDVAKVLELAGKKKGDQKHPTSMFVNAIYQPLPETQINLTANMTNDQSHQVSKRFRDLTKSSR